MREEEFEIVGARDWQFQGSQDRKPARDAKERRQQRRILLTWGVFLLILLGCLLGGLFIDRDPAYMDLAHCSVPPCKEFLFGTDEMGRDLFAMVWHGGRISLFIGGVSTLISTGIAVIFGAVSGSAPKWADTLMMRLTEILLSVPGLLTVVLFQTVLGKATVGSISIVIGITSWMSIAKVVRTEVRRLRGSEYIIASKCMGGGFFHVLWKHLTPNFMPAILFMVVMNIRNAIIAESTLSFMGLGLPVQVVSWGSMLSLAEKALLTNLWWVILIPGMFLLVTLLCITQIGNDLRKSVNRRHSNL